jgi:hypothetical protein
VEQGKTNGQEIRSRDGSGAKKKRATIRGIVALGMVMVKLAAF